MPRLPRKTARRAPRERSWSPDSGGQQCVRVGDWKANRRNVNPNPKAEEQRPGVIEIYDLAADPGEKNDVADEHKEVVARLRAIMEEQHVKSALFPLRAMDGANKQQEGSGG